MKSHTPVPAMTDQQIAGPHSGEGDQAVSVLLAAVPLPGASTTDFILRVHSYSRSPETF